MKEETFLRIKFLFEFKELFQTYMQQMPGKFKNSLVSKVIKIADSIQHFLKDLACLVLLC